MKGKVSNFFIGLLLAVIGTMMFLRNITLTSNTGGMLSEIMGDLLGSTGRNPKELTGIMFVVIFVMLLIMCIKTNIITVSAFILSVFVAVFSIIAGMKIQMAEMSGLDMSVMVGMMIIGLGLVIGSVRSVCCDSEKQEVRT